MAPTTTTRRSTYVFPQCFEDLESVATFLTTYGCNTVEEGEEMRRAHMKLSAFCWEANHLGWRQKFMEVEEVKVTAEKLYQQVVALEKYLAPLDDYRDKRHQARRFVNSAAKARWAAIKAGTWQEPVAPLQDESSKEAAAANSGGSGWTILETAHSYLAALVPANPPEGAFIGGCDDTYAYYAHDSSTSVSESITPAAADWSVDSVVTDLASSVTDLASSVTDMASSVSSWVGSLVPSASWW